MPTLQQRRARARAGTELRLTVFAAALTACAYVLVVAGTTGKAPRGVAGFVAVIAAGYLAAHLATTRLARGADPAFVPTATALAGIGYAVVYRLDHALADNQFAWLLIGLALFVATLIVIRDHRVLDRYTYTIGLVGIGTLLLPMVPGLGESINGERLWIHLGPLSFQPSEIAKVLLVIFLASYLDRTKELLATSTRRIGPIRLPEPRSLGPLLVAWGVALVILFAEDDLGTSLLFFGIFLAMLWAATGRSAYLAVGLVLFAAASVAAYLLVPHVQVRIVAWLHALSPRYVENQGYQVAQGEFAMASGGILGTGLGQGHPGLIPAAATDFVFASLGEELGLLGTTVVLLMYLVLVWRGLRAALGRDDGFGKLLATGLSTTLGLQTFVIVGGITRLIPLTGVTLPFVSYGGSSLITNFILLALLVRISAPTPRAPAPAPGGTRAEGPPPAGTRAAASVDAPGDPSPEPAEHAEGGA